MFCNVKEKIRKYNMHFDERVYQIGISLIPGIGSITAKKLIEHFGSASNVFSQKKKTLRELPRVGDAIIQAVKDGTVFRRAEEELLLAEKKGYELFFFQDKNYPKKLKQCYDSPVVLFYEGNFPPDYSRVVAIVGTRKITPYGEMLTEKLVQSFVDKNILIVSGLAYGVDALAHKLALKNEIPTIGVLAHGLDKMYPAEHKNLSRKMVQNGGLLTDYLTGTKPDKENFPQRNRIVAGLCDALIVIESGESGGSMITAEFANNYSRDVFAFPGRISDPLSAGCHKLIRQHKAALIESGDDLLKYMRWDDDVSPKQFQMPVTENEEEEKIILALREHEELHEDELSALTGIVKSKIGLTLLQLEMRSIVKGLAGKKFRLMC
jgi:DNA processing protein